MKIKVTVEASDNGDVPLCQKGFPDRGVRPHCQILGIGENYDY